MIFPSIVLMSIALVPVVLLETSLVSYKLQADFKRLLTPVGVANLVSTFVGIPLTWFLLTVVEFSTASLFGDLTVGEFWSNLFSVSVGAPWIAPGHKNEEWVILAAMLFVLIPYDIASWVVEYYVIRLMASQFPPIELRRAVGKANLASYILLAITVVVFFAVSMLR